MEYDGKKPRFPKGYIVSPDTPATVPEAPAHGIFAAGPCGAGSATWFHMAPAGAPGAIRPYLAGGVSPAGTTDGPLVATTTIAARSSLSLIT